MSRGYVSPIPVADPDYIALNPVRAGLVQRAIDWPWSSAAAQVFERSDPLVSGGLLQAQVGRLDLLFETDVNAATLETFRNASASGLPIGSPEWIRALEEARGRRLRPVKGTRAMGDTYASRTAR